MMAFFIASGISWGLSTTGQRQYASQPDAVRVTMTWGEATRTRSWSGLRSQKDGVSTGLAWAGPVIVARIRAAPRARFIVCSPTPELAARPRVQDLRGHPCSPP